MAQIFRQNARLDGVSQLQQYDLLTYLPNDILVKVGWTSMFASLEVRAPLLDHQLFEFAARIPPHQRMTVFSGKRLLKAALGKQLPTVIKCRSKQYTLRRLTGSNTARWRGQCCLTVQIRWCLTVLIFGVCGRSILSGQTHHKDRLWAALCFLLWSRTTI